MLQTCMILFPLMVAQYLNVFGGHPLTPTLVAENWPAKVVAVSADALQVVVVAPGGGGRGDRLVMIERPKTSYLYVTQWPDAIAVGGTVAVCYTFLSGATAAVDDGGSPRPAFDAVDIDCEAVRWSAFMSNAFEVSGLLMIILTAGILVANLAATLRVSYVYFRNDRLNKYVDNMAQKLEEKFVV